jgi:type I restriction enzyme R subunit
MSDASRPTGNFAFLARQEPQLAQLPAYAELYCHSDPNAALVKLRLFGERLAQEAAARFGSYVGTYATQAELLGALAAADRLPRDVVRSFHLLRKLGNEASHEHTATSGDAIHALKVSFMIGAWFHRSFTQPGFRPGAFVAPTPPVDAAAALKKQLSELQAQLTANRDKATAAEEKAALAEDLRKAAEAEKQAALGDLEAAFALAEESEEQKERFAQKLERLHSEAQATSDDEKEAVIERAEDAANAIVRLDEADTRKIIDFDLRQAGWEVDSKELRHSRGVRPQKGRNIAIAEWPTQTGPADYVLFRGLEPLGIVEAKRQHKNVANVVEQAKRYSRSYDPKPAEKLSGPWGDFKIPFLFATNGRPYLAQLRDESGIHFLDARHPNNHSRALDGWYTPEGLKELSRQDIEAADQKLAATPNDLPDLRPYQRLAIRHVEEAIAQGRREILLSMATGTGKTRTAIGLIYRLIKTQRFRRILFVVDRSALGEQAQSAFKEVKLENLQTFTEIYNVKELGDATPDTETRLHFATVQGLVKRILYNESSDLAVDAYDAIVIDECHRGYTLDRDMSDAELGFKDQDDYISKYRRALAHFDAVKIGLTATPALHTTEIFGNPVYNYGYRQAVVDGFLSDCEPPIRMLTKLARDGIHWEVHEDVQVYSPAIGQIDLFQTPDEIHVEIEEFNRGVQTENFNRTICEELTKYIDPSLPGKTLIFCVDDRHADLVVRLLKEAFGDIDDDAVMKITGSVDKPLEKIRLFKNEIFPSVVVTVDLLTTGIDVPEITSIVFLRRVRSRILYHQMLGRATRLCPDLYGRGEDKEFFRIFDAVDICDALEEYSDMKPVVVQPKTTFNDLARDLVALTDDEHRRLTRDQWIAKLSRKRHQIEEHAAEPFLDAAGLDVGELLAKLRDEDMDVSVRYFKEHADLGEFLDRNLPKHGQRIFISGHDDEIVAVEQGYGHNRLPPDDYLEEFAQFLKESGNKIPALLAVTQRPRELTRQQLRELKLALDKEGYGENDLRSAWTASTNVDIAASIIGFIRQRALGDPLRPYEDRVTDALQRILKSRDWTLVQRQWLTRIGKQMKKETIVDVEALDRGAFGSQGGFRRLNKIFDGHINDVLGKLHEEVWRKSA